MTRWSQSLEDRLKTLTSAIMPEQVATSGGGCDVVYVDKKKLRHEHKRRMMVSYRKEKKKEQTHLKSTLHRLEQTLQSLTTRPRQTPDTTTGQSALPWKEVARALLDESTASQIEHPELTSQLERHTLVLQAMKQWVVENTSLAFVSAHPIDFVVSRFQELMCDALMANSFFPIPDGLVKQTARRSSINSCPAPANLLVGTFGTSPDRTVLVARQILHDDMWKHIPQQRNRCAWLEFRSTADGRTNARIVLQAWHRRTLDGVVPMVDEAILWGSNLRGVPEHLWESRLRVDLLRLMPAAFAKIRVTLGV
ncbi:hypothetical protein AC1031_011992 [Aphanomyces cochlioides]|nr:hypothetical protein AC1031_011992 [Aphanomyces cochlioides]